MTSQGVAPVSFVPVPRVGPVRVPRGAPLHAVVGVARLGLAAVVAVALAAGTAVASGPPDAPLRVRDAARAAGGAPGAALPLSRPVAAPPLLKVGSTMALPM